MTLWRGRHLEQSPGVRGRKATFEGGARADSRGAVADMGLPSARLGCGCSGSALAWKVLLQFIPERVLIPV